MIDKFTLAKMTWGTHPHGWPTPPPKRPYWWQRASVKRLRELESVFGHLDNESLKRYYDEVWKGQSVYEDYGGNLLRCYQAMMGKEFEDPITEADIIKGLLEECVRRTP